MGTEPEGTVARHRVSGEQAEPQGTVQAVGWGGCQGSTQGPWRVDLDVPTRLTVAVLPALAGEWSGAASQQVQPDLPAAVGAHCLQPEGSAAFCP